MGECSSEWVGGAVALGGGWFGTLPGGAVALGGGSEVDVTASPRIEVEAMVAILQAITEKSKKRAARVPSACAPLRLGVAIMAPPDAHNRESESLAPSPEGAPAPQRAENAPPGAGPSGPIGRLALAEEAHLDAAAGTGPGP